MKRNEILNLLISESIKEVISDIEKNYLILENEAAGSTSSQSNRPLLLQLSYWESALGEVMESMTVDIDGTTMATVLTFLGSLVNILTLPGKVLASHAVGGAVSGIFYIGAGVLYLRESEIAVGDKKQQFKFLGMILMGIGCLQMGLSIGMIVSGRTAKLASPLSYKAARDAAERLSYSSRQIDDLAGNGIKAFNAKSTRVQITTAGDKYKMLIDNREVVISTSARSTQGNKVVYRYKDAGLMEEISDPDILKLIDDGNKAFIDSTQESLREIITNRRKLLEGEAEMQNLVNLFGDMRGKTTQGVKSSDVETVIETVMVKNVDGPIGKSLNQEYLDALNEANRNLSTIGFNVPEDTFVAALNASKSIDGSIEKQIIKAVDDRKTASQIDPSVVDDIEKFKNLETPPAPQFLDAKIGPSFSKIGRFLFGFDSAVPEASAFSSLKGYRRAALTSLVGFYDSALAIRNSTRRNLKKNPIIIDIDIETKYRTVNPAEIPLENSSVGLQIEIIAVDPRGPMIGRLRVKDASALEAKRASALQDANINWERLIDQNSNSTIPIDTGSFRSGDTINISDWKKSTIKKKEDFGGNATSLRNYNTQRTATESLIISYNKNIKDSQSATKTMAAGELGRFVAIDGRSYDDTTKAWMKSNIDNNQSIESDLATYYRVINDANVKSKIEQAANSLYSYTRGTSGIAVCGGYVGSKHFNMVQSDGEGNMTFSVPTWEGSPPVIIDTSIGSTSPADTVTIGDVVLDEIINSTSVLTNDEVPLRLNVE